MNIFLERLNLLKGRRSEADFARQCDLPYATMRMYLKGSMPSLDKAEKIATAHDVSIDWLFGISDMENPNKMFLELAKIHNSALIDIITPLVAQELITINKVIDVNKLSLSIVERMMKGILSNKQYPLMNEIIDLGDTSIEVMKNGMIKEGLSLEDVALRTGYEPEFLKILLKDLSEWNVDIALKIGKAIKVSALDLLFPLMFDSLEKRYFELISSATPVQKEKMLSIRRAASDDQNTKDN